MLTDSAQRFFWTADDCAAGILGHGTWSSSGSKLALQFDSINLKNIPDLPPRIQREKEDTETGKLNISFKVVWAEDTNRACSSASIRLFGIKKGCITDSSGNAFVSVDAKNVRVLIGGTGIETDTMLVSEPGTWSIVFFAKSTTPRLVKPHLSTYKISKAKQVKNGLVINDVPGQKTAIDGTILYYRRKINESDLLFSRYWLSLQ